MDYDGIFEKVASMYPLWLYKGDSQFNTDGLMPNYSVIF